MRIKIIVVLFIIITFFGKAGFAQRNDQGPIDGLKFIISTDKSSYLEGEVVWEEFQLIVDKNIVKLDYKPYFAPNDEIIEKVVNSKNQEMPQRGPYYTHIGRQTEYPDTICYFSTMNIGVLEKIPNSIHSFRWAIYLPADEYEFSAYVIVVINGMTHKIKSEPVKFTVLKPVGEEALARQSYLEILSVRRNCDDMDLKSISEKVDNFISQYPNSIYIDQVFRTSDAPYFDYYKKNLDDMISITEERIKMYPNFASNYERLKLLMQNFESKNDLNGFKQFISELKSEHKDNYILNKVLYYTNRDFETRHGNK
jgi:hypothetical protein